MFETKGFEGWQFLDPLKLAVGILREEIKGSVKTRDGAVIMALTLMSVMADDELERFSKHITMREDSKMPSSDEFGKLVELAFPRDLETPLAELLGRSLSGHRDHLFPCVAGRAIQIMMRHKPHESPS